MFWEYNSTIPWSNTAFVGFVAAPQLKGVGDGSDDASRRSRESENTIIGHREHSLPPEDQVALDSADALIV